MTKLLKTLGALSAFALLGASAQAVTFHTIDSVTTNTVNDLWTVDNLIQGAGVGFDANNPHNKLLGGPSGNWVTHADAGYPADYIAEVGTPVLTFDLGSDVLLSEISVWGYASSNANGVKEFSLGFATEADGLGGFGSLTGSFFLSNNDTVRQSFAFSSITARYVQFTAIDNFFAGDGTPNGQTPGGDRVGLGEVAFARVPDAGSTAFLMITGLLGLIAVRRKVRG